MGALVLVDEEEQSWGAIEQSLHAGSDEKLLLSPLGRHLARLPVHPRLGKILVYGTLLGCVGPVLSVAAAVGSVAARRRLGAGSGPGAAGREKEALPAAGGPGGLWEGVRCVEGS